MRNLKLLRSPRLKLKRYISLYPLTLLRRKGREFQNNVKMTPKEALAQTGRNLKQIRTDKGWSVEALAVLSRLDAELIEGIECGNMNYYIADIFTLAATLNVDFRRIMVDNVTI